MVEEQPMVRCSKNIGIKLSLGRVVSQWVRKIKVGVNCDIRVNGIEFMEGKEYTMKFKHSGYYGGKSMKYYDVKDDSHKRDMIMNSVAKMLPKNKSRKWRMLRLRII